MSGSGNKNNRVPRNGAYQVKFPNEAEDAQGMFNILWTAFCLSFTTQAKGYENLKVCNRIGEKLQEISDEVPDQQFSMVMDRTLNDNLMLLEPKEWDKLKVMVKSDEIPWTHMVGQQVEETVETLEACEQVETKMEVVE